MSGQWHFNIRRACDRMRDSANDAFFTAESIENLSEGLVREGIQNSLDAATRDQGSVRQVTVRIAFQPRARQEVHKLLSKQFASVRDNFAGGLGIPDIERLFAPDTGYLVFEDFGTRGLTGDVNEYRLEHAEQNAFFSFFRAEGRSSKTGENLGRWGIGKQVFSTASRLHAMFGLSVRADAPQRVLMGSAVIRTHSVNGQDFQPDAWFGCRDNSDDPVKPITAADEIDAFVAAFDLKRADKTGLSVIVPCIDERVSSDDLRRGIVRSFFWPILLGELVVDLEAPDATWRIDSETVSSYRDLLPPPEAAVIEFAGWASTAKPADIISLPEGAAVRPEWSSVGNQLLPESTLDEIRSRLETDQRVGVRIPVRVRPKFGDGAESMSFFVVFIASCRDSGHSPIFLRDGIVITDVRSPQMSGTRSLVVVDHRPLAGLLGDAEGVNHTQWQKDSRKFHNRYVYGPQTIRFVSRSVFEIVQRLHAAETKGDPSLLLDIFFLPIEEGVPEPEKKPEPGKPDVSPLKPNRPPPPKPKPFAIDAVKGGFLLRPGSVPFVSLPAKLRIEAGYAVRRGNPMKRWAPDDFSFTRPPLRQDTLTGLVVTHENGNNLEVEIRKPEFRFSISGFDTKRDLVVRAIALKEDNEADV
jgi:hypothetical protein